MVTGRGSGSKKSQHPLTLKTVSRFNLFYARWKIQLTSKSSEGWAGTGQEFSSSFPLKSERLRQTMVAASKWDVRGNLALGLGSWRGQLLITWATVTDNVFWGLTRGSVRRAFWSGHTSSVPGSAYNYQCTIKKTASSLSESWVLGWSPSLFKFSSPPKLWGLSFWCRGRPATPNLCL